MQEGGAKIWRFVMPGNTKALVASIDDDPITLNTILNTLKPSYDVRPFVSGETFLKFIASTHVDLILLDCNMPGMDGFEVMTLLHGDRATREIPILFLTSKEEHEYEILALDKGAADYLRKPTAPRVLHTRVRHHLELQQYRKRMKAMVEEKTRDLAQTVERLRLREDAMLNMLAMATDLRDHNTGDHIQRTTEYIRLIAEELLESPKDGYLLSRKQANDIIKSSKLHDVGKIAVPDHILGKPGKLTDEEFSVVKRHPAHGAKLLDQFVDAGGDIPFLAVARDIALYHHEKWDGTGYPFGRKGREIPLAARIVTIADVYDALISVRPYKKAFTHEQAVSIITGDRGRHFDPYLIDVFIKCSEAIQAVSQFANGTTPQRA